MGGVRPARHQHLLRPQRALELCSLHVSAHQDGIVYETDHRVAQLIKPFKPCGAHAFLQGNDSTTANMPCTCTENADGTFLINEIGEPSPHAQPPLKLLATSRIRSLCPSLSRLMHCSCSCAGTAADPGPYYGTTNACIGSEIPFEKALVSSSLPVLDSAVLFGTGV